MARAFRGSGRGSRLRKHWQQLQTDSIDAFALTATQAVIASSTLSGSQETTVLRSRGQLLITATPDAAADSDVVGLGLIVVTASAVTVGSTALPHPLDDASSDFWLWHQYVPLDSMGATTEATARTGGTAWARVEIDSKAMRKAPQGSAIALVGVLDTQEFAAVEVWGGARILIGS